MHGSICSLFAFVAQEQEAGQSVSLWNHLSRDCLQKAIKNKGQDKQECRVRFQSEEIYTCPPPNPHSHWSILLEPGQTWWTASVRVSLTPLSSAESRLGTLASSRKYLALIVFIGQVRRVNLDELQEYFLAILGCWLWHQNCAQLTV